MKESGRLLGTRSSLAGRGPMTFDVTKRLLCPMLVVFCVAFCAQNAQGQCTSLSSGDWNVGTNWSCGHQPTSADGAITVATGHTMTVTAAVTVDQVTVNSGGEIDIATGVIFSLNHSVNPDLLINGTVSVTGTLTQQTSSTGSSVEVGGTGTLTVNSGGLINGSGGNAATAPSLTVDSGGIWTIASGGALTSIGTGRTNITINSGGNATLNGPVSAGTAFTFNGTVNASANVTIQSVSNLQIGGTVTMTAGTLQVNRGNGGTMGQINSGGSLILQGSSIFDLSGVNTSNFSVLSGGTLDMGASAIVNGGGFLIVASGANLKIGSAAGITTGVTGNVQTTGNADTYATTANYTYDGPAAQVTGNALPATVNNLTIDNSGGNVTLTNNTTVAGVLALNNGDLVTGAKVLTQSGTSAGNTDVIGDVQRADVGGTTRSFGNPNVQITNSGGTLSTLTVNLVKASPLDFGNSVKRTYTLTGSGSVPGAVVRLHYLGAELNGNTEATLELWRKDGTTWNSQGATTRGTAVDTDRWVEATGVTAFSPWTIGPPSGPSAVEMVSYSANHSRDGKVLLQWETGQEVNNLGFNIYREEAGKRMRLNKSLVVGSGFMATPGTRMTAGYSYAWRTGAPQTEGSVFWIEEIDFSGRTVWHGPIYSEAVTAGRMRSAGDEAIADRTVTLSDLNQDATEGGVTVPVMSKPQQAATSGFKITADKTDDQSGLASQPAVKISVKQEGWYRVTQPELVAAGLRSNADPNFLQLFADGQEVPISVLTNNGKFDSTAAIAFYGLSLDTPSTDRHVYWLIEDKQGKRIANSKGNPGLPSAASYLQTVERRDQTIYVSGILNGEAENFFGSVVSSATTDQAITLQHVDAAAARAATIEVGMRGLSLTPHVVTVNLNGTPLGTIQFDSQAQGLAKFTVPNSTLTEGQNHMTLTGLQGVVDVSLVDHIRVSYWHTYAADGNALRITASANQQVTIGGFTNSDIKVLDTTLPGEPAFVSGEVTQDASGYAVTLAVPGTGSRTLFAFGADQVRSAVGVVANVPSSLKSKSNQADLVIIAHGSVKDSFAPLAALRRSQGLKVAMVDVEDIYDEFNNGNKSAQAVKDFLSYTRTEWKVSPKYVLLGGSASYDPKNYNGLGAWDLTPTKLIDTSFSETANDDWFADFNNDGVAEMAVGRLPAHTAQEAATMVSKLLAYESSAIQNSALLVADDSLGYYFDFEAANAKLAGLFPKGIAVQQINRGQIGTPAARQRLLDGIASGQKIVNYVGHGSPGSWRNNLLSSADAMALQNAGRYPLFVAMTCLNGQFQHPQLNPLAVALMNAPQGGAIAVWASSGFTLPSRQAIMNQQLYTLLFSSTSLKGAQSTLITLGEATTKAKASVSDLDVRRTWILLGDPSMKLR
jgi:hypothetical protein